MTIHTVRATDPVETWAVIDCDAADCTNFQAFDTLTDDDEPTASFDATALAAHAEGWQTQFTLAKPVGHELMRAVPVKDLCPVHADDQPGFVWER